MRSVHPSPTAGDGLEIEQSRYIKKADRLDRMIRCAQCGFIVDLTKRGSGDSLGAIGSPTIKTGSGKPPDPGISFSDTYGDPVDTKSGCPFCNSLNPEASGRSSDPWTTNSRNVENL